MLGLPSPCRGMTLPKVEPRPHTCGAPRVISPTQGTPRQLRYDPNATSRPELGCKEVSRPRRTSAVQESEKAAPVPHRRRRGRQLAIYFFAVVVSSITEVATRLLPSDL